MRWDLIAAVLAGMFAIILAITVARARRVKRVHILGLCVLVPLSGFIGAWLFRAIENLLYYHNTGPIIGVGMRAYGLNVGALVAALMYVSFAKLSFWRLFDTVSPSIILFMAVYRFGCVVNGCCYGLPCDLPWAVIYTHPSSPAPLLTPVHPTQIYHLLWALIVLVAALILRKKFHTAGLLGLVTQILYFAGDFAVRLFRGDEPSVLGLSLSQITGLIFIAALLLFLFVRLETAGWNKDVDTVQLGRYI